MANVTDDEFCPNNLSPDNAHCDHWWEDLDTCCRCGASDHTWELGMPITQYGGKLDCAIYDRYDMNLLLADLQDFEQERKVADR